MTTPITDRLEHPEGERLELRPARWQLWALTLVPLTICSAFAAVFWFGVEETWSRLLALIAAAFGVWAAVAGHRQTRRTRVRADAEGVSFTDGSRRGYANRHAHWNDVASCTLRRSGGVWFVLKNRDGRDAFVFQDRLLSRRDAARLLRFAKRELESRNAVFDVPARWYER